VAGAVTPSKEMQAWGEEFERKDFSQPEWGKKKMLAEKRNYKGKGSCYHRVF